MMMMMMMMTMIILLLETWMALKSNTLRTELKHTEVVAKKN